MGLFDWFGNNPLQAIGLGLGIGGDVMHGISSYTQAQQMRDLRNKQMDPNYMNAMTNQYFNANKAALQQSLPDILRQTVNPMLGMQGIDPSGGNGRFIMDQAVALQLQNAYANAQNQARSGIQGAGQFVQPVYGQGGGTGNALMGIGIQNGLQQALQNTYRQRPQPLAYSGDLQYGNPDASYFGYDPFITGPSGRSPLMTNPSVGYEDIGGA